MTTTTVSKARLVMEWLSSQGMEMPTLGLPAPSSVTHQDYAIGYYADHSVLIWARHYGYLILDEERAYYRDTIEHLARCLGMFTKQRRAELVARDNKDNNETVTISGVIWDRHGDFVGLT